MKENLPGNPFGSFGVIGFLYKVVPLGYKWVYKPHQLVRYINYKPSWANELGEAFLILKSLLFYPIMHLYISLQDREH